MFSLFLWQYAGISAVHAQNRQREPLFLPAVTILVVQYASSNQARVAVAYDSILPQSEVMADIARLARIAGTQAADVHITQEANRKGRAKTTAVDFFLLNAPPIANGEPQILPYLMGFQNRKRLEIVFSTGAHFVADSLAVADTPQALVRRFTEAQGGIRYEAEIRDAKATLPGIVFATPVQVEGKPVPPVVRAVKPPQRANPIVVAGLILLAVGFFGFAISIHRRK